MSCYENVHFAINKLALVTNFLLKPPIFLGFDYFYVNAGTQKLYIKSIFAIDYQPVAHTT